MGGVRQSPFSAPAAVFQEPTAQPPPQPPSPPPRRKQAGRHPRTSPQAVKAILKAGDAGESYAAMAKAGQVTWPTAKRIWHTYRSSEPPGKGRGAGDRPGKVTPAQVRKALGARKPNGRWEHSAASVAAELGVTRSSVYRAMRRAEKSSSEEEV